MLASCLQYVDKTAGDEACGYKTWFRDTIGKLPKGPNSLVSIDSGEHVAGRLGLVDKVVVEPVLGNPNKVTVVIVTGSCHRDTRKLRFTLAQVMMAVGLQDWQCPWADNILKRRPALEQGYPEVNQQQHLCVVGDAWDIECLDTLTAAREWASNRVRLPLSGLTQDQADQNTHSSAPLLYHAADLWLREGRKDVLATISEQDLEHCEKVEEQLTRAVGQGMTALSGILEIVQQFTHHAAFDFEKFRRVNADVTMEDD